MSESRGQKNPSDTRWQNILLKVTSRKIDSTLDAEARRRVMTTVLFGVSMSFWGLVFVPIYIALESVRSALVLFFAATCCLSTLLLLKVQGLVPVVSNLIAALVLTTLLTLALFTGGFRAPAMIWVPVVPVIAILLCNWRSGRFWLIATSVSALAIYMLEKVGALPKSDLSDSPVGADWLYIVSLLGMISCTTLLCFVFDYNSRLLRTQMEVARSAAELANRAKSGFVAHMSHEIRTPLNGVIGMLELLRKTKVTSRQQEYVQLATQSADSLLRILNDILDFSKIEAGRLELESIPFRLRDVVGDTLQALEVQASGKKLELACRILTDVPDLVEGDPGRLQQIIVNLVGNALKFTEQGEVVVCVSNERLTDRHVTLRFSVSDTGVGVPNEKRQQIFEAFRQADSSTTRRFGGTGLGLNISRQLIEMMGGHLELESLEGQGSTFCFTADFDRPTADSEDSMVLPASCAALSVLVIDDNATSRFILQELLSCWNMLPTCVDGAEAALEALEKGTQDGQQFQLVLLDMMMPEVDGWMFAEQFRSDPRFDAIPLITLFSAAVVESSERCETLRIFSHLRKPVKQHQLLNEILRCLDSTAASPPQQPATNRQKGVRPLRILLAEDGLINRKVALGLLESEGHSVRVAENGLQAVRESELESFDLILMDVEMPQMDGLEATAAIRERERSSQQHTPIVAMTAHALKGDRERFLAAGMDAHVPKPINSNLLHQVIADLTAGATVDDGEQLSLQSTGTQLESSAAMAETESSVGLEDVLNPDRILACMQDDDAVRDLARHLCDEAPRLLRAIQQALADKDAQRLQREAHTLKGSADIFSANNVVENSQRLEELAREGRLDESSAIVEQLGRDISQLTAALNAFIQQ